MPLLIACEWECERERPWRLTCPVFAHTRTNSASWDFWTPKLGKRRLLAVEVPAIEAYNDGRDPEYRIVVTRITGSLVLSYCLKPCHNVYRLETRLLSSYPSFRPRRESSPR